MMRLATGALALGLALTVGIPAAAQEASFSVGRGDDDTTVYRLGTGGDFAHWHTEGAWQWTGAWLAELGYWDSDDGRGGQGGHLWEAALTPLLRLERSRSGYPAPHLELGLGGHLLSDTRIGRRELSTAWQFGSHLGLGVTVSPRLRMTYRFQHLSNASIKQPNDGINLHLLTLDWKL